MIKVSRVEVSGLANALYGMRLPKNSHHKSDTLVDVVVKEESGVRHEIKHLNDVETGDIVVDVCIGDNDLELAETLVLAGDDHGKWLRQVSVSMLIEAPMTFFFELDTYKISTTKNSSSRMHKLTSKNLTEEDMSWDDEDGNIKLTPFREIQLQHLNKLIDKYNDDDTEQWEKKEVFRELIQDLPDSFNFKALWTGSAKTCRDFHFARKNHKQKEMRDMANIMAHLPQVSHFITLEE